MSYLVPSEQAQKLAVNLPIKAMDIQFALDLGFTDKEIILMSYFAVNSWQSFIDIVNFANRIKNPPK